MNLAMLIVPLVEPVKPRAPDSATPSLAPVDLDPATLVVFRNYAANLSALSGWCRL
jgi:hypothetical protein